jgi:hypothetical protein
VIGGSNSPGVFIGREDGAPQEVWKFPLARTVRNEVEMPGGAKVIEVAMQGGMVTLWAVVTPGGEPQERIFYTVGTGHRVSPDAHTHLGTVHEGPYVFHIFEGFK